MDHLPAFGNHGDQQSDTSWAVVPFDGGLVLADLSVELLYAFALSSLGDYAIITASWVSTSKYYLLLQVCQAQQTAAQM